MMLLMAVTPASQTAGAHLAVGALQETSARRWFAQSGPMATITSPHLLGQGGSFHMASGAEHGCDDQNGCN
eukprot:1809859-Alexandrium_andersonii.AAC.1